MVASATGSWGSVWSRHHNVQPRSLSVPDLHPACWEYGEHTAFSCHSLKDWLSRGAMPKVMPTSSDWSLWEYKGWTILAPLSTAREGLSSCRAPAGVSSGCVVRASWLCFSLVQLCFPRLLPSQLIPRLRLINILHQNLFPKSASQTTPPRLRGSRFPRMIAHWLEIRRFLSLLSIYKGSRNPTFSRVSNSGSWEGWWSFLRNNYVHFFSEKTPCLGNPVWVLLCVPHVL